MNTTLQAAIFLGQDSDQDLRFVKNHFWSSVKKFIKESVKLIKNQTEIIGVYHWIDHKDYIVSNHAAIFVGFFLHGRENGTDDSV